MIRTLRWLLVVPLVLATVSDCFAAIRCGGCSDPCAPRAGLFGRFRANRVHHGYGTACVPQYGYGVGSYSGYSQYGGYSQYSGYSQYGGYVGGYGSQGICAPAQGVSGYHAYGTTYAAPSWSGSVVSGGYSQGVSQPAMGMGYSSSVGVGGSEALSGSFTSYQTVMKPTYVTETQYVAATEYQNETRYRVRKAYRTVPVEEVNYRTKLVMVPRTETKTVEYSVVVPETSQKSVEVTNSVPVWNDIQENYTVKVPYLIDIEEAYTVRVATLKDQEFEYTVQVPQVETVTKMQTVTNSVPVTKKRTVQRQVPSTRMQTVTKDYGHWETVIEEVPYTPAATTPVPYGNAMGGGCSQPQNVVVMGGCGNAGSYSSISNCGRACRRQQGRSRCNGCYQCQPGCYSGSQAMAAPACGIANANQGCGSVSSASSFQAGSGQPMPSTRTQSRRVWVPNVVTEEVPVIHNETVNEEVSYTVYEQHSEQIPVESSSLVYRPEIRTGTKKVVEYVNETRTRTRKQVEYRDESRTRTRKELSYRQETKTETYPVVSYRTEKRTKDVSFTVNTPEYQVEQYTTTRHDRVAEDVIEEYTVRVAVPSYREVQVQVCKMVPELVPVKIQLSSPAVSTYSAPMSSYGSGSVEGNVVSMAPSYGYAPVAAFDGGNGYGYGAGYGAGNYCLPYAPQSYDVSYGNYVAPFAPYYDNGYRGPFLHRRRCR